MAKKKATPKQITQPAYAVALNVNGGTISVQGESVQEALKRIPAFTPKTTGTLYVTYQGKTSRPMTLNINAIKRIMANGASGEINRTVLARRYEFFS